MSTERFDDTGRSPVLDKVRRILAQWEDGVINLGEFEASIMDIGRIPLLETLEKGEEYILFGSCCCSAHEPNRTFKAEFTIQPHGFTARRIE